MAPEPSAKRQRRRLLLCTLACSSVALPLLLARAISPSFADPEQPGAAPEAGAAEAETSGPVAAAQADENAGDMRLAPIVPEEPIAAAGSSAADELAAAVLPPAPAAPPTAAPRPAAASFFVRPRDRAVLPILMYHHVNDLPRTNRDAYLRDLTVPIRDFKEQLELLERHRARTVSLDDLLSHLRGQEPLPERAVVLSFDDGYEDNFRLAYPLLRQYGMVGTFFVVGNLVGQPGYATWEQLREMQRHGMAIESHSLDHVDLAIQPEAELRRQLNESRRLLQLNLLRAVRFIAYPSGKYSPQVVAESRAAGYEAAVTVNSGLIQRSGTPFELNRVRVRGADTVESLAAKLVPSHWMHTHGRFGA